MARRKRRQVECAEHGPSEATMICRHLCDGKRLGYYRVKPAPGRDDLETALCAECDALVWEEDGWTDRVYDFADWQIYCRQCFERTLKRHRLRGVGRLAPDDGD